MRCFAVLLSLQLLASCATPPSEPETSPDMTGTITRASENSILVEEVPEESSGSAKASVRITSSTGISSSTGKVLRQADLRPGDRVSVWFSGPVAESYPVQGTARKVVVQE